MQEEVSGAFVEPRVFVINEPMKKDEATGELSKWLPMESAANFGRVVEVLPPGSPPADLRPYVERLGRELVDFGESDYLVLVGEPALLVAAALIIGSRVDRVRLLKWDRRMRAYAPVQLNLEGIE